jgi:hypothetical protein
MHPCDHPAVALAITRGLPGQLQKATSVLYNCRPPLRLHELLLHRRLWRWPR